MSRMWWYTLGVVALWFVNPELRRLYDWRFGFSTVEVISILPLLSIVPHFWSITFGGGWKRLPFPAACAAWLWVSGFAYALVLSFLAGNLPSGAYAFVNFVFPIGVGLWVAADDAPFALVYKRLTRTIFGLATFVSVYGIIQYAVLPPWDLAWLRSVISESQLSFGLAAAFQIRVFSTLADPGTLSIVLSLVLLLALPELSLRKPLLLVQIPIWLVTFALTMVRTGWLMCALGTVVYLIFAPRRANLIAAVSLTAVLLAGALAVLPGLIGNDELLTSLDTRFQTFSDLEDDASIKSRQGVYDSGLSILTEAPFGHGLGIIGTATKLSAKEAATDFDSGILGRVAEMGLPGCALYVTAMLLLLYGSVRLWFQAHAKKDVLLQTVGATAIAFQAALGLLQVAHDTGGPGLVLFFIVECLAIRALSPSAGRVLRGAFA